VFLVLVNLHVNLNQVKYFPICLFAFNRPEKLSECIDALLKNSDCEFFELYVFCDGPRTDDEYEIVARVRSIAKNTRGFKRVHVYEADANRGLANSIIYGLDFVLKAHSGVIVLEDDIVVSPKFLKFINDSLNVYENIPEVGSVHGNFNSFHLKLPPTFFLKYFDCWGWGTWRDSWSLMIPDSLTLMKLIRDSKRINEFNVFGTYRFYDLLQKECSGVVDSWAIRWQASLFVNHRLSLYSKHSLVHNTGTDGSGAHEDHFRILDRRLSREIPQLSKIPVKPNRAATLVFAFGLIQLRLSSLVAAGIKRIKVRNLLQICRSDSKSSESN